MTSELKRVDVVKKVWGTENHICNNGMYCGKLLHLKQNYRCSIHKHKNKHETFYLLSGNVLMETSDPNEDNINQYVFEMKVGDVLVVEPNTWHRFSGVIDSTIIEVSTFDDSKDSYRCAPSERIMEPQEYWFKRRLRLYKQEGDEKNGKIKDSFVDY